MKPKHQRMLYVLSAIAIMGTAAGVIVHRFRDNLIFFYTPTRLQQELATNPDMPRFRLGGIVKQGSVGQPQPGVLTFIVSDGAAEFEVRYHGLPPTLFREGQGVVMLGRMGQGNRVEADDILAKHDENYMPPEVAEALKESGHWAEDGHYGPQGGR